MKNITKWIPSMGSFCNRIFTCNFCGYKSTEEKKPNFCYGCGQPITWKGRIKAHMEQKVLPFRAVIELSDGSRVTRDFFAESESQAHERANYHANYERHVRFGESVGGASVMLVAEVAGAPRRKRFDGASNESTSGV